jgi:hypothetical protein
MSLIIENIKSTMDVTIRTRGREKEREPTGKVGRIRTRKGRRRSRMMRKQKQTRKEIGYANRKENVKTRRRKTVLTKMPNLQPGSSGSA